MQLITESRPPVQRDRMLRLPEVKAVCGIKSTSTIYAWMHEGKFPKNVRLSGRMVLWPESAVLQWVQDRIAQAAGDE